MGKYIDIDENEITAICIIGVCIVVLTQKVTWYLIFGLIVSFVYLLHRISKTSWWMGWEKGRWEMKNELQKLEDNSDEPDKE